MKTRPATVDDAAAIRDIYNVEVAGSVVTFDMVPRSLEEQRQWLTARSGAHAVIVAEEERQSGERVVVGFGSLSPFHDRPGYATSVEDSIYVHRDYRGQGIGSLLLGDLVDVATAHGFHAMFARVVGGHEASIALHRAFAFDIVGTEREVGRKFGRWLDVVVMERLL